MQVSLEADVVVSGLGHLWLAEPLAEHIARVAGATACAVVLSTGEAGGGIAHGAGQGSCADHLVVGAGTGVRLFGEATQEPILIAVENRLDAREPVGGGSRNTKMQSWKSMKASPSFLMTLFKMDKKITFINRTTVNIVYTVSMDPLTIWCLGPLVKFRHNFGLPEKRGCQLVPYEPEIAPLK